MAKRKLTLMERRLQGHKMPYEDWVDPDVRAKMKHIILTMDANFLGEWSGTKDEALDYMKQFFPRSIPSALANMEILTDHCEGVTWHSARFTLKYTKTSAGIGSDRVFIGTTHAGLAVESIFYQAFDPQGSQRYWRFNGSRQLRMPA